MPLVAAKDEAHVRTEKIMQPNRSSAVRPLTRSHRRHLIFNLYTSGGFFILTFVSGFSDNLHIESETDGIIFARVLTVVFGLAILLTIFYLVVNAWLALKLSKASFAQRKAILKRSKPRQRRDSKQPRMIFQILLGALATIFWVIGIAELLRYRF